ncbi:hypothetical protein ACHAXT_008587 [Thalassiosira profunda]
MDPKSDLQLVPETLLKKRHDLDAIKAQRAASSLKHNSRRNPKHKNAIKILKPETIIMQSRARTNAARRFKRVSKKGMQMRASNKSVVKEKVWDAAREEEVDEKDLPQRDTKGAGEESEEEAEKESSLRRIPYKANSVGATTVFAILIRPSHHKVPGPVKKTLNSLRLRQVNEGVFLPYHAGVRKMLHLVEPYVLYGTVTAETVADLVRRRGFGKADGRRVPLKDNNVIEAALGEHGLICVEDLIQTLAGSDDMAGEEGDTFKHVAKFLCPFRLTARKSKFQQQTLDMHDGKLYGDQGEAMNGYVREML